ncbi:MAG TPA: TIM-barrel domain-containing protein [Terracidiphilus sp.]|nr:TIM-barrel domain-containing protein [Terracidiphilus sp.]
MPSIFDYRDLLVLKLPLLLPFALLALATFPAAAQSPQKTQFVSMPQYTVAVESGVQPRLNLLRNHQEVFAFPIVAGLASPTRQEQLSNIHYSLARTADGNYQLNATAQSNLWSGRRFQWRFFPDHIEFQQFASGHGPLGRAYFLSNGVSNRWDSGTTDGHLWDMTIDADRYFAPNPNHANQFEFNIAMPQILGFSVNRESNSDQDFRPERMTGIFAPPPLFLAFHLNKTWTGIGIGAKPGDYQFPALEYTGSRYAGASFFVDYQGYRSVDGDFASPVLALHFAYAPLDALAQYTAWLDHSGFSTQHGAKDVLWHHLPIFCGWAEQTTESVPLGGAPNKLATQANYEKWIATLEQRGLPVGTIVIDDKWQKHYGTFEVDTQKWPDLKAFIADQHRKGRHVLLWVPVADTDGLPDSLCVMAQGKCVIADVGKPAYETFLRARIHHLVADIGIDGFKEDWVGAPAVSGLPLTGPATGIEFVRRFQWILWSQAHKDKPDAMVETQTPNALFRESSDLIRLNDIWYATRNVPQVMRLRARIANISGWPLVDTDNASSTTLKEWWDYAQAQPSIGIPALYFVSRTEATQESPTPAQWSALAGIWQAYINSVKKEF